MLIKFSIYLFIYEYGSYVVPNGNRKCLITDGCGERKDDGCRFEYHCQLLNSKFQPLERVI